MYLRVDFYPNRLYKWNGVKWIPVDKNTTDVYAQNDDYIELLLDKLAKGEYAIEDLTVTEQERVSEALRNKGIQ